MPNTHRPTRGGHGARLRLVRTLALIGAALLALGLVVTPAAAAPGDSAPVMYQQPESVTVEAGSTARLVAVATGDPSLSEQWQVSTDGGTTWANVIAGGDVEVFLSSTLLLHNRNLAQDGYRYRAQFTSDSGNLTSDVVNVEVSGSLTVTAQPAGQTVRLGDTATFSFAASSPATTQWSVSTDNGANWSAVAGATGTTLTIPNATLALSGNQYRAALSVAGRNATTDAATLTVVDPPAISQQPASQTVSSGASATFTAASTGSPTPAAQWQVSTNSGSIWSDIAGATSPSLTLPAVAFADNGNQYRVVFSNGLAEPATSSAATLTVRASAPAVSSHPLSLTVPSGGTAMFTAAATGDPTPTVQWQVSRDHGVNWADIARATSGTVTLAAVSSADSGTQYHAVFTAMGNTATSNAATLTVSPLPPTVSTQPRDAAVTAGDTATFTAAADGDPAPTVQWRVSTDSGVTWNDIDGATGTMLTLVSTSVGQSGSRYHAVFTNGGGSAISDAATLTVSPAPVAPVVTASPTDQSVHVGEAATFTAAASGVPMPTVQWQVSTDDGAHWSDVDGATGTTLTLSNTTIEKSGSQYQAVFRNTAGTTASTAATLVVTPPPPPAAPVVTTQPSDQTVLAGETATFTAAASGTPTPTVWWEVSTDRGATWTDIDGATGTTLTLLNTSAAQSGSLFKASFWNQSGYASTSIVGLTVTFAGDTAPVITRQPQDQGLPEGFQAFFVSAAVGSPAPTVQWQVSTDDGATWTALRDREGKFGGATDVELDVFNVEAGDSGRRFRAVFTNSAGSVNSSAATLTVYPAPIAPVVTADPANQSVRVGDSATFTTSVSGTRPLNVQWLVSTDQGAGWSFLRDQGGLIAGSTDLTLTVLNTTLDQSGSWYKAKITNNAGGNGVMTSPAALTVLPDMSAPQNAGFAAAPAAGATSATVAWDAPDKADGLTGYRVTPIKNGVALAAVDVAASPTSHTVRDLEQGVRYQFSVAAKYGDSVGPASTTTTVVLVAALDPADQHSNETPDGDGNVVVQGAAGAIKDTTVAGHGTGKLVLTPFVANPAAPPAAGSKSTPVTFKDAEAKYFDVYASGTDKGDAADFTTVTIKMCAAVATDTLFWWDPTAGAGGGEWVLVAPAAVVDPATGCLTVTLNNTDSSPLISDLTGTMFASAAAVKYVAPGGGAGDGAGAPGGGGATAADPGGSRIAGLNRYATAAALALEFAGGRTVPAVVVANGATSKQGFDALSANFLAGQVGGPIVLVEANRLPSETATALKKIVGADTVIYVMGRVDSVSQAVAEQLTAIRGGSAKNSVIRVGGNNRYATSAAAALAKGGAAAYSLTFGTPALKTAILASGEANADALAAGPFSFGANVPVLLTAKGALSPQVAAAMRELGVQQVIVLGGSDRISASVVASLAALGVSHTVRIDGADRYDTSTRLYVLARQPAPDAAHRLGGFGWGSGRGLYLANGAAGFADALAAGPLAGSAGSPLLAVGGTSVLPPQVAAFLRGANVSSVSAIGGTDRVSEGQLTQARTLTGG